jgi:hypothetical protein
MVVKSEGKRSLGRPEHRWKDNVSKINHIETECEGVDWTHLSQDRDQFIYDNFKSFGHTLYYFLFLSVPVSCLLNTKSRA